MAYPDVADLVAQSSVLELTTLSEEQQQALYDMSIMAVERFTGQSFVEVDGPLIEDGAGGGELWLSTHVEELTGVSVKGSDVDLSDVTLSPKGDRLFFAPQSTDYAVAAMRETTRDSRTFRAGPGTVTLEGTFGWSETPVPVKQALRLDMEDQARSDASKLSGIVAVSRRLGIKDISQGNLRATLGVPGDVNPQCARLLANYVWSGRAGYLL